jgi:molybdopterin/thiamine biosynthesis adenylyltransferase
MANRQTESARSFAHLAAIPADDLAYESTIASRRLRIMTDAAALRTESGQVAMLTAARLAPRLCHQIEFVCPRTAAIPRLQKLLGSDHFSGDSLAALARRIWPHGRFSEQATRADALFSIGGRVAADVVAGVDRDGAAVVTHRGRQHIENPHAPYAAAIGAALACAQISKLLYPEILRAPVESEIRIDRGPLGGKLDDPQLPLQRSVFAGVGAVGSAAIFALIVTGAAGRIVLIDPDIVSDSNLMRYILFDDRHLRLPKINAAELLANRHLEFEGEQATLQEYLERHPEEREQLRQVVVSVDSYSARREIAAELPREILNAGTTPRDFTISRHFMHDGFACLACLYPERQVDVEIDAVMARELGLGKQEVVDLRRTKRPLALTHLERIAEARHTPVAELLSYLDEPIDSLYNKEVCAKISVPTRSGEAIAPLGFGSTLAGLMLAHTLTHPTPNEARHFRMDFIRGASYSQRGAKRQRLGCDICGRDVYRRAYERRWG